MNDNTRGDEVAAKAASMSILRGIKRFEKALGIRVSRRGTPTYRQRSLLRNIQELIQSRDDEIRRLREQRSRRPIIYAVGIAVIAIAMSVAVTAQSWPPAAPAGDNRVVVTQMAEDTIVVSTPYNYTSVSTRADFMYEWAEWACGLYQRVPVHISFSPSDIQCDAIGLMAERSAECWHDHLFACAVPPADLKGRM